MKKYIILTIVLLILTFCFISCVSNDNIVIDDISTMEKEWKNSPDDFRLKYDNKTITVSIPVRGIIKKADTGVVTDIFYNQNDVFIMASFLDTEVADSIKNIEIGNTVSIEGYILSVDDSGIYFVATKVVNVKV
jgi:hypothetical protein